MSVRNGTRGWAALAFAFAGFAAIRGHADAAIAEPFTNATVATPSWQVGGGACLTAGTAAAGGGGIVRCPAGTQPGGVNGTFPEPAGNGALRLTSNTTGGTGYVLFTVPQTSAGGIQATFTEYSYDTPVIATLQQPSGDGLSLFLVDATSGTPPATAGSFAGEALGYGKPAGTGIANGYVGIGFDELGAFSTVANPQSVAVRGSASSTYAQVASVGLGALGLLGTRIDTPAATTRGAATAVRWRVTLAGNNTIQIEAAFGGGAFQTVVAATSLTAVNGALPASFYIGLAASTNAGFDIHEISNLSVVSLAGNYGVSNGPVGVPAATGSYDGAVAVNPNDDFTERSFMQAGLITVYSATPNTSTAFTAAVAGISVPNQLANTGTSADTYTLTATAPAGWLVQLFPDNGLGTPGTGAGLNAPGAVALYGSAPGATSTGLLPVAAGSSAVYWAVLTSPAGIRSYTRFDTAIVATSTNSAAATNTTHDELYSGFVYATKALAVTATNCVAGVAANAAIPAGGVCSGGTLQYSLAYGNIALPGGAGNTEPASALLSTRAGTFAVSEDGNLGTNNWGTFTNGLNAAPVDSNAASTFTYGGSPYVAGSTSFTDVVGGAAGSLGPGAVGTIVFNVTVR